MELKLHYEGKTKTVYDLENGLYKLFFKDDVTGTDGKFDPGANTVGLTIDGAGAAGLRMSVYFFKLLTEKGIKTHFVSADETERTMTVKPMTNFGNGLEVICRFKALGSFMRRYGSCAQEGQPLDALVEMTLKDDDRGDPLITRDALEALGILKEGEYKKLKKMTKDISKILQKDLAKKGLELCDIKLEFGRDPAGKMMLVDELSAGNMRVFENGKSLMPLELTKRVLGQDDNKIERTYKNLSD